MRSGYAADDRYRSRTVAPNGESRPFEQGAKCLVRAHRAMNSERPGTLHFVCFVKDLPTGLPRILIECAGKVACRN